MQRHWSVDEKAFKKRDPKGYKRWQMIQRINYGLDGKKLQAKELVSLWPDIRSSLDPLYRNALIHFLWHHLS
jgi:hypothetical protein